MMECWVRTKHAPVPAMLLCCSMRLASLAGLLVVAMGAIGSAKAGASDCYHIKEDDVRHYCLALARRDTGGCDQIKDGDRRNLCLAQVKGQRSYCYAIRGQDARHLCMAEVTP